MLGTMRALRIIALVAAARAALQRAPCEHFIILKYAHTGSDGTGQAACDHFLDICERKMGLSTCLKLEHFTMGKA